MPFEIVRNDITNMQVDAIVNTTSTRAVIGFGVDTAVHKKAGPQLLDARKKLGGMDPGTAAITSGYGLEASYVIHVCAPTWRKGETNEEKLLRECYKNALSIAKENRCESIAFPLLAAGNKGFPKSLALTVAISEFSSFLAEHEMHIFLVVFNREAFALSEKLFKSVASYVDEHYVEEKIFDEYGIAGRMEELKELKAARRFEELQAEADMSELLEAGYLSQDPQKVTIGSGESLDEMLSELDAGFSETLLHIIDSKGKTDTEVYKKANIDRKLFSKIRNNINYRPSKATALAFAIALELNIDETRDFIGRAGYALSRSSKFDIIIEYFIIHKNYDIFEINEVLFAFDQVLIGG